MSEIPASIEAKLVNPVYRRRNADELAGSMKFLAAGQEDLGLFGLFFEKYEGPFHSDHSGFELLDVQNQDPSIYSNTKYCREQLGWPPAFIVLTDLLGGSALVFEYEKDKVYVVDFEGGDEELVAGTLEPYWSSFEEFLLDYFR